MKFEHFFFFYPKLKHIKLSDYASNRLDKVAILDLVDPPVIQGFKLSVIALDGNLRHNFLRNSFSVYMHA